MEQKAAVKIESEDKKIIMYVDSDTSLGAMHDFLLSVKGEMVSRISKAQAEEEAASAKVKEEDDKKIEEIKKDEIIVE